VRLEGHRPSGHAPTFSDALESHYTMAANTWDSTTREENIFTQSMFYVWCELWQQPRHTFPALHIELLTHIPPARGLGSSATALVAGLLTCNALLAPRYGFACMSEETLLQVACLLEGHPDNTTPALLGGVCLCNVLSPQTLEHTNALASVDVLRLPWPSGWVCLLCVPESSQTSTKASRAVLPSHYTRQEVITSVRQSTYTALGLALAQADTLAKGLQVEVIHQPYRTQTLPHWSVLQAWANDTPETIGMALSGSGPTVLWIGRCSPSDDALARLQSTLEEYHVGIHPLEIASTGAKVDFLALPS
jgi:homoserine kinase